MKKIIISIVAVAALVAMPMIVMAQNSDKVQNVVSAAKIATAIDLTKAGGDLDFGTIRSGALGGTVTLTGKTVIERTSDGGVSLLASTPTIPTFTVNGEPGYAYTILIDNNIALAAQGTSGGSAMNVTINAADGTDGNVKSGGTLTGGSDSFKLNAVLEVAALQAADTYEGAFDVTVTYN